MARLHEAGEIVCIDTVAPALDAEFKARGRHCNAFLKLSGLIDAASSALFSNHLASVLEHHARRQLFALSLRLKDGATTADIEHLLADIGSSTKSLVFAAKDHSQRLRRPSSYAIPPDNDPSILLGDRYLNRGDGMILSSTSGMGKSSMSIQMAYHWALGRPAFGIKSNGPLRSLIIQAEDSDGDVAEVCQSIEHVLELNPEERATIDQNIAIVTERVARGLKFVSSLKALIAEFKPDLVWINPLQAFMDGDVKESKDLGFFLREQLNHLNDPPQFGYVVVHHTTKPPSEKADRKWNEVMYDMAGGAEIINWARAIMSLRAGDEPGDFNLVLAKRGARAGVTRRIEDGLNTRHEVVTTIPLRHAKGTIPASDGRKKPLRVIFWEGRPGDKPAAPSRDSSDELSYSDFASVFPKKDSSGLPIAQLIKALSVNRRMTDRQLHPLLKSWVKDGIVESIQDPKGTRYRQAV